MNARRQTRSFSAVILLKTVFVAQTLAQADAWLFHTGQAARLREDQAPVCLRAKSLFSAR